MDHQLVPDRRTSRQDTQRTDGDLFFEAEANGRPHESPSSSNGDERLSRFRCQMATIDLRGALSTDCFAHTIPETLSACLWYVTAVDVSRKARQGDSPRFWGLLSDHRFGIADRRQLRSSGGCARYADGGDNGTTNLWHGLPYEEGSAPECSARLVGGSLWFCGRIFTQTV